jgi:phosphonate transport system permease protein
VPAGIAALIVWSWHGTRFDLLGLLGAEGRAQMLTYARKLFPPDLSADFLMKVGFWSLETFAISFMGTLLSVVVALALVFLSSRNLVFAGVLFEVDEAGAHPGDRGSACMSLARALLNLLRTVPHIIWALIFVFAVGLGPFFRCSGLGLHTGGVLGNSSPRWWRTSRPSRWRRCRPRGRAGCILFYGVLPRVLPQFLA